MRRRSQVYDPAYQHLIKRLRVAREKAGLTQSEAGRLLGWTQAWIAKVERGERRIDPVELVRFAKLYRRRLSYFLGRGSS